jgi:hypothetical protein
MVIWKKVLQEKKKEKNDDFSIWSEDSLINGEGIRHKKFFD